MLEPDQWDSVLSSVRGTIVRGGSERISSNRLLDRWVLGTIPSSGRR
jgi:hypothetical protein